MIVCSCNVLSDTKIRLTLENATHVPTRVVDVYHRLGCRAKCGRCACVIRDMMRQADAARPSEHVHDDACVVGRCSVAA
jgi:bacterioferritin-associated ferredoxin